MAAGSMWIQALADDSSAEGSASLLFSVVVGLFGRLGLGFTRAAAILSALGWSAAAFAFLAIGRRINRSAGSAVAALLLCSGPFIIASIGNSYSWVIALAWWSVVFLLNRRPFVAALAITAAILLVLPAPVGIPALQLSLARAFAWSIMLFLVGISAEFFGGWLAANGTSTLNKDQLVNLSLSAAFLLVGGYQLFALIDLFQMRPQARWEIENDIASWLQMNTPVDAVIGSSKKVGYLANRQVAAPEPLATRALPDEARDRLLEQPVDYLVSDDSLPWQLLANSRWFRLNYRATAEFDSPYVAEGPFTIWHYQPPPPALGAAYPLNARIPDRLRILGYQVNQEELASENKADVTLYLEAAAAAESSAPFSAKIRMLSPMDSNTLAEWDYVLPSSSEQAAWLPGASISEQLSLTSLLDLEPGAYPLNISLRDLESDEFLPISLDNDLKRLDRIQVGYVLVPAAVDLTGIETREVLFANKVKLLGFTSSDFKPGEALEVSLYWQPVGPLEDNYVVFSHILDSTGQLVASHDSIPDNGRFPTHSWLPGETIVDSHLIQLPADLPAGEYQVRVGLYIPETGERLAITAGDEAVSAQDSFLLTSVSIP